MDPKVKPMDSKIKTLLVVPLSALEIKVTKKWNVLGLKWEVPASDGTVNIGDITTALEP